MNLKDFIYWVKRYSEKEISQKYNINIGYTAIQFDFNNKTIKTTSYLDDKHEGMVYSYRDAVTFVYEKTIDEWEDIVGEKIDKN